MGEVDVDVGKDLDGKLNSNKTEADVSLMAKIYFKV